MNSFAFPPTVNPRNLPGRPMSEAVFPGTTGRFFIITFLSKGEVKNAVTVSVESKAEIFSHYGHNARILAGPCATLDAANALEPLAKERDRQWDQINPLRYIEPGQLGYIRTMEERIEREAETAEVIAETYGEIDFSQVNF